MTRFLGCCFVLTLGVVGASPEGAKGPVAPESQKATRLLLERGADYVVRVKFKVRETIERHGKKTQAFFDSRVTGTVIHYKRYVAVSRSAAYRAGGKVRPGRRRVEVAGCVVIDERGRERTYRVLVENPGLDLLLLRPGPQEGDKRAPKDRDHVDLGVSTQVGMLQRVFILDALGEGFRRGVRIVPARVEAQVRKRQLYLCGGVGAGNYAGCPVFGPNGRAAGLLLRIPLPGFKARRPLFLVGAGELAKVVDAAIRSDRARSK